MLQVILQQTKEQCLPLADGRFHVDIVRWIHLVHRFGSSRNLESFQIPLVPSNSNKTYQMHLPHLG